MSTQRIVDVKPTDVEVADITKVDLTDGNKTEPTVPTKFQGKTVQDMIEIYQNLEKVTGNQARELGELRGITDTLIQQSLKHSTPSADTTKAPLTDEEFLESLS